MFHTRLLIVSDRTYSISEHKVQRSTILVFMVIMLNLGYVVTDSGIHLLPVILVVEGW